MRQQEATRPWATLVYCWLAASGFIPAYGQAAETDNCLTLYEVISKRQTTVMRDSPHESSEFYRRMHELEDELFVALQQCQQHPLLFSLMAENQIALQNIQLAFIYASKARQRQPDIWQTNHALGTVLVMQEEYAKGLPLLEKALRLAPEKPALYFNLCSSYVVSGRYQQAVRMCSRLLEQKDHQLHGPAYFQRSLANRALGNQQQAEADAMKAKAYSSAQRKSP